MRRALLGLAALAALLVWSAACGRSGLFDDDGGPSSSPELSPTPFISPTPSPTSTPYDDGDGHDGSITFGGTTTVINLCEPVTTASGNSVELGSAGNFAPGQRLLLLQSQDGFATSADASDIAPAHAGHFAIVRINAVNGGGLSLIVDAIPETFETDGPSGKTAQACRVPQYSTVTVSNGAVIPASQFDGTRGGVVAFYASTSLTMTGTGAISADGAGFRGGIIQAFNSAIDVETNDTTANTGLGGGKGEGLDGRSHAKFGRGNYANGAGGGNSLNAGGGGGGNGGYGGLGGEEFSGVLGGPDAKTRGFGGSRVMHGQMSVLSFGGGGGGGQQDIAGGHMGPAGVGGNGGGLVFLVVKSLAGTGAIHSDGLVGAASANDGGGGGGAGGTIVVIAIDTSSFTGHLEAKGAAGGACPSNVGPGGGSGGGRIFLSTSTFAGAAPPVVSGGAAGLAGATSRLGTAGTSGELLFVPVFPIPGN